jgi:large subunit ribosomal protein L18
MDKKTSTFSRRQDRVRYKLRKHANGKVRLSVYRSGKHIYAQLIDDASSRTLAAASTLDKSMEGVGSATINASEKVGLLIAERAKLANVHEVVFDRGGYIFHGRIKALADAARSGGLKF